MLDPSFFTSPDRMRQLQRLMAAPYPSQSPTVIIADWGINIQEDGTLRMRGAVSVDFIPEDATIVTAPIWQLNYAKRLIRTSKRWITLDCAYHENTPPDIEMEAVGPRGYFVAPCIAERYLMNIQRMLEQELTKY